MSWRTVRLGALPRAIRGPGRPVKTGEPVRRRAQRPLVLRQRRPGLALLEEQVAELLTHGEDGARRDGVLSDRILEIGRGAHREERLGLSPLGVQEPRFARSSLELHLLHEERESTLRDGVAQRAETFHCRARPLLVARSRRADRARVDDVRLDEGEALRQP